MALNNPNDPTSQYPSQPGSAFSFNFNPQYIAQLSANPTNASNGGQAPSGFANLSQQSTQNNTQNNNPVAVAAPQLLKTGANIVGNSTGFTNGISGAINNFGVKYLGTAAPSPAGLAGAPGMTTASYVNAAGDSVAAGTPGAIATGANADIANSFTAAQAEVSAANGIGAASSGSAVQSALGINPGSTLGSLTAPGSLMGSLGAAGLGYIGGNILAKAVGENATNGGIGGAIGAGLGMAIAGPLGALVGGVGGSLFGGMFGPGAPTNAEGGGGSLNANGTVNYQLGGQKNAGSISGFTQQASNSFSNLASAASQALGIKFNPNLTFGAAISTKHPGPGGAAALEVNSTDSNYPSDTGKIFYNPNDPASVQNAQLQALKAAAQQSGYTDTTSLESWFKSYSSGTASGNTVGNATNIAPSVPVNPNPSGQTDFQKFIDNYKAQQSVNAA